MASIRFDHVVKTYDNGVTVIPDLNLEIQDQEFVVLVGPSGCGKSTTLRMIAGLEEVSGGGLYIGEQKVNDLPPKDRNIAMVFQSYALYPHMSVYRNMAFALRLKKLPKEEIDRRVRQVAAQLELEPYLKRKPRQLSGGQRQRVALGRAMVRDPQVFLLDEPLSNLDAKLRTEMRAQISTLHKHLSATFVYVTHDQTEAMTMGDRIVVMKDGRIQQVDTPQALYDRPKNRFVAGFIGSPQMNFWQTEVLRGPEGWRLRGAGLEFGVTGWQLEGYEGKTVTLGIRPEDIHAEEVMIKAHPDALIRGKVSLAERMGSEIYAYFASGGQKLIARAPARTGIRGGDEVVMALDLNKLHLFDADTGERIPRQG